jgi:DNA processing protein
VPGRLTDKFSEGCNHLIKTNQASLIQSAKDIEYLLGWQSPEVKKKQVIQKPIFVDLDPQESKIVEVLQVHQPIQLDLLGMKLNWPVSKVFPLLTMLELKGVVKGKPGRVFELT